RGRRLRAHNHSIRARSVRGTWRTVKLGERNGARAAINGFGLRGSSFVLLGMDCKISCWTLKGQELRLPCWVAGLSGQDGHGQNSLLVGAVVPCGGLFEWRRRRLGRTTRFRIRSRFAHLA